MLAMLTVIDGFLKIQKNSKNIQKKLTHFIKNVIK